MSSKTLRKQLLAAVAMVIVAAIAVTSSTFAWFAANTTVTATNMSVTAKSDASFLLIKAATVGTPNTVSAVRSANKTTDNAVTASAALYPTAHTAAATNIGTIEATSASAITSDTILTNWYYKNIDDPRYSTEADATAAGAEAHETTAKEIPTTIDDPAHPGTPIDNIGNYILINEFTLALAEGSNAVSNLKVGHCTITPTQDAAVKVLVATSTACEEFGGTGGDGSVVLRSSNLTTTAGSDTETVRIYIYWDGTDTEVFTNNIARLQNTTVSVTFTADVVNA